MNLLPTNETIQKIWELMNERVTLKEQIQELLEERYDHTSEGAEKDKLESKIKALISEMKKDREELVAFERKHGMFPEPL